MVTFCTRFDLRAPAATGRERSELYRRCIEQAAYLQARGRQPIMVSEHHASDDGYLPSPIPFAAAIAAATPA